MKYTFALFMLLAGILACGSGSTSEPDSVATSNSQTPPDGKKLYKINCVNCHGLYGNMGGSGAFDLTVSELTLEERIQVITNGRNVMTPFKSLLDEEEIRAVAKYTFELKKGE